MRGRERPVASDLLPAAGELLREAAQMHVPLRIAVPEMLEDAALAELAPGRSASR